MAINNYVETVRRHGPDVVLITRREPHMETECYRIRNATIEPHAGDFLHFGSAGTLHEGTCYGGHGFIAMDGNEFPYRRISCDTLIQDW